MISLALAKSHVRIDGDFDDSILTEMIEAAQGVVELHTGWYLGPPEERTLVLSPILSSRQLWLPQPPEEVIDVEGLTAEDWELRGQKLIRLGERNFWHRDDEYEVTVIIGYDTGSAPAPLRQAALKILASYYANRELYALDSSMVSLPEAVSLSLAPYRSART